MSEDSDEHILQRTYASNIHLAISGCIFAANEGDYVRLFNCCETVYNTVPIIQEDIDKKVYDEINQKLADAMKNISVQDITVRRTIQSNIIDKIKRSYAKLFYRMLMKELLKHGYLEIESHRPKTRETGLARLEEQMKKVKHT